MTARTSTASGRTDGSSPEMSAWKERAMNVAGSKVKNVSSSTATWLIRK